MVQNLTKFGWTIENLSISMKKDKKSKEFPLENSRFMITQQMDNFLFKNHLKKYFLPPNKKNINVLNNQEFFFFNRSFFIINLLCKLIIFCGALYTIQF